MPQVLTRQTFFGKAPFAVCLNKKSPDKGIFVWIQNSPLPI